MINSKKKGNHWENVWANWCRDNGIKAWKDGASGGGTREKGDVVNNLNLHMEVKAVKGINLQKVWKKALLECEKTHNNPLIAIHFDGMKDNDFLVVINNHDWIDMVQRSGGVAKIVEVPQEDSREKKWKIERTIQVLKDLLKEYA